jgi:rhamnose utilization protein RhaD (predicted bifunctional aldolase and dehydrogenase)
VAVGKKQTTTEKKKKIRKVMGDRMITLSMDHVSTFLDNHQTAKVVVVVSTHSLEENGQFVWGGDSPQSYKGCFMRPVGAAAVLLQRSAIHCKYTAAQRLSSTPDLEAPFVRRANPSQAPVTDHQPGMRSNNKL